MNKFKLRSSLVGHSADVRGVCPSFFPENGIISVSRDVTTRIWTPKVEDCGFAETQKLLGHSNFISAVCMLPPSEDYANGLIVTASSDKTINVYSLESDMPLYTLKGHDSTVCALTAGKFGMLLSGSWDKTARVWSNRQCLRILEGHTAAVWAVAILPGTGDTMLSASADKTVKLWQAAHCQMTFQGHTDVVRGLAVLSVSEFLSCSNDTTIRHWSTSGSCLHIHRGHESYIYSIAILPNGQDFVTCGEDRTLRVWNKGECVQTIAHPTQSVWSVSVLPNGDIVSGSSDGIVYVFSQNPGRQAPEHVQTFFAESVAASAVPKQIGDIPMDKIPGIEALLNAGKRDGQQMMVKKVDGGVELHSWSASEGVWTKVGDVTGSAPADASSDGKKLFNGKEYDYVFDVALDENKPALKLPYNISSDPWLVAHKFLDDNQLDPAFLDQVVKFIQTNTGGISLGSTAPESATDPYTGASRYVPGGSSQSSTGSSDPYTGSGRYIPGSSTGVAPGGIPGPVGSSDPMTGESRYVPGNQGDASPLGNAYIPRSEPVTFDNAKPAAIIEKLNEFNRALEEGHQVPPTDIANLEHLMVQPSPAASKSHLRVLCSMLSSWPQEILFPVLDVMRLALRLEMVNSTVFGEEKDEFVALVLSMAKESSPKANQMLVMRVCCNAFLHTPGSSAMMLHQEAIIAAGLLVVNQSSKMYQVALSTLLLNYAVALRGTDQVESQSRILQAIVVVALQQLDFEAVFRLLVALGTLIIGDDNCTALARSLDLPDFVSKHSNVEDPAKVGQCARMLQDIFR